MTKKILYVEDEPDIQTIAQVALETIGGFIVKLCSSGEEALQEVDEFAPDIILLDVMMPGMDGIQAFQQLSQLPTCVNIPVVFMTARVQADEIRHYRELGAAEVIAKPFDPMTLADKVQTILNGLQDNANPKLQQFKNQRAALRATYAQELPAKIAAIEADWQNLKTTRSTERSFHELIRKAHSLSGSGATFDFPALSDAAQRLELQLRAANATMNEGGQTPNQALDTLVAALGKAAVCMPQSESKPEVHDTPLAHQISNVCPRVLLIYDDSADASDMRDQLEHFAIRTETADSVPELQQKIESTNPSVILIESNVSKGLKASIDKIEQIKQAIPKPLSLVVVSSDDSLESRLSAVKAGALAYFLSPVKITELVDFIRSQQQKGAESAYRVLIVDDDELFVQHTALLLNEAGMETNVVTQPMLTLEALTSFKPELILMDLHMPECSGIELAAVIRQHCNYTGTAIVFFSVDSDIDRHLDAMRAGGDEFLIKSTNPIRLLATIETRVKRSRTIQRLMLRDNLTGLLNRASMDEYLHLEISKIKRQAGCFSYVILDLDHFKRVNDHYGHLAGDEVLKSLGLLLVQRLRTIDLAGRFGGEEFVIILPGTSASQAEVLLNELLQTFSALKFSANQHEFFVTFSAGVAEYPYFSSIASLVEAADQALYQAKAQGRNQIYLASLADNS